MKSIFRTLLCLLFVAPALAQTAVTGTVVDTSGVVWSNASIKIYPFPEREGVPAWVSAFVPITATADTNGNFSATIPTVPSIVRWSTRACPVFSTSICPVVSAVYISGTSQVLTVTPAALNLPAVPSLGGKTPMTAYADSEIINPPIGFSYLNYNLGTARQWTGSAWVTQSGGGGASLPSNATVVGTDSSGNAVNRSASSIGTPNAVALYNSSGLIPPANIQNATDSQPGVLSAPDHTALSNATTKISAATSSASPNTLVQRDPNSVGSFDANGTSSADHANTGSGSGSNGVANALANCSTFTCMVQVSKLYSSAGEPSVAFTGLNQVVTDNRGGNNWIRSNDLTPGTLYRENVHNYYECGIHQTGSTIYLGNVPNLIGDCGRISLTVTAPGFNNGAGTSGTNDAWPTAHALNLTLFHQGGGIKSPLDTLSEATGPGDLHIYDYFYYSGGQGREPAAEGVGRQMHISERTTHYTGTITAVSSGTLTTTSTGAGSVKNLGALQRIIDTTARMSTGYVTTVTPLGDGFVSVGLSGGGLTPSAWSGTLDAAIHVPTIPSTGSNAVGTSVTFNITTTGGSVPTVGQGFNLTLPAIEHCVITAVSTLSTNHYAITALVMNEHTAGVRVQQWAGRAGFEWVANTITTPDSLTLRYDLDVVGAVDSSHAIVTAIATGNATGLPYGLVDFGAFAMASYAGLANTGGVVTVTAGVGNFINNHPDLYGATVTISGAANSAFNTACTNARNLNPAAGTFDCSQSGSTGQTSAANSSGTFGVGNQPTGNTAYNLYPAAQVIDIQRYPAGANPVVDGTLRLEPYDTTAFTVGHAISMDHDYVLLQSLTNSYQDSYNPYSANSGLHFSAITGANGSSANANYNAYRFTNFTPSGFYAGLGGFQSHPGGVHFSGVWGSPVIVDNPTPQEPLLNVKGCPFIGCTDPNATTPLWTQPGNGGQDDLTYYIATRRLNFNVPLSTFKALTATTVNGVALSASSFAPVTTKIAQLFGFGDSYMQGVGVANQARDGGFGLISRDTPTPNLNFGVSGNTMPQIANRAFALFAANPTLPSIVIQDGGLNDGNADTCGGTAGTNCVKNYQGTLQAALAWESIPNAYRIRASTASLTGTRAADTLIPLYISPLYASPGTAMSFTSSGATATFSIPSSASTKVGLTYTAANSASGTFTVSVDGTSQTDVCSGTTTFSAGPCGGTALAAATSAPFRQEFTVTPGASHTLVVTTGSATNVSVISADWVPPSSVVNVNPVFEWGTANVPTFAANGIYDTAGKAVVSQLAADGLPVYTVDLRNGAFGTNVTADVSTAATSTCSGSTAAYHPNNCGAFDIYNQTVTYAASVGYQFSTFNGGGQTPSRTGLLTAPPTVLATPSDFPSTFQNLNGLANTGSPFGVWTFPPYRQDGSTTGAGLGMGFYTDQSSGLPFSGAFIQALFNSNGWVCDSSYNNSQTLSNADFTGARCTQTSTGNTYQTGSMTTPSVITPLVTPTGASPTCTVGSAAGTSATCSVTGHNQAHLITVNTGTSTTANATLVTVTFNGTLTTAPTGCSLTARSTNAVGQNAMVYTTSPSTTAYTLAVAGSAIPASISGYTWFDTCF